MRVQKLLAAPAFAGDEDRSLKARQLHAIAFGGLAAAAIWALGHALLAPELRGRAFLAAPFAAVFVAALALNRAGRVRLASALVVASSWLILAAGGAVSGYVRETSFAWLLLIVLTAALLLGRRAAFVLVVLSVIVALALLVGQRQGWAPRPIESIAGAVAAFSAILVLAVALLHTATHTIGDALRQARRELGDRLQVVAELEEHERRLRALLDATTDPAFLMTADGTLLAANEALATGFGRNAADIVGQNVWSLVPPEVAQARRARIAEVVESGRPLRFEDRGADGRSFDNSVFPVRDEAGRVSHIAVFARDITAFREAQAASQRSAQELERAYGRLAGLDRAKSDFITVTAHELRTPLTLVMGYADLLEGVTRETPGALALVGGIRTGAQRLHRIVEDMLDMVSIERDAARPQRRALALADVVGEAVAEFERTLGERRLSLAVEMDALPPVFGDPAALGKALHHLVMNAIKFTPDGGRITIRGRAVAEPAGPAAELVVEDTGIGIDPADQKLIFDTYFKATDVRYHSSSRTKFKGGGPGLGLALARKVVQAHGGRLWVESSGHDEKTCPGSRFGLVLPCAPLPGVAGGVSPERRERPASSENGSTA